MKEILATMYVISVLAFLIGTMIYVFYRFTKVLIAMGESEKRQDKLKLKLLRKEMKEDILKEIKASVKKY